MRRTLAIAAMAALLPWGGCSSSEDSGHHGEQTSKPASTSRAAGATTPPHLPPWGPGMPGRALELEESVSILLDADKFKQYGLTHEQVAVAIKQHKEELQREFAAGKRAGELLENVVVATVDGEPVRLKDVATIRISKSGGRTSEHDITAGKVVLGLARRFLDWASTPSRVYGQILEFRIAPAHPNAKGRFGPLALTAAEVTRYTRDLQANGPEAGRKRGEKYQWFELRCKAADLVSATHKGRKYVLLCADKDRVLPVGEKAPGGCGLKYVYRTTNRLNKPVPGMHFDDAGARMFSSLTEANVGNHLAVLVNGIVLGTPTIREAISDSAIIPGDFTEKEADDLVEALRYGVAPEWLGGPSSRKGADSRRTPSAGGPHK